MNSATSVPAAIDMYELPTISVVLPFFNSGSGFRRTTEALTALEYPHLEFVLVDDGSSDASADIAQSFVDRMPRARLVTNPVNLGAAEARNRGLKLATGEYVWFVDSDDEWSPSILMQLGTAVARANADVAICRVECVDDRGRVNKRSVENFQGGRLLTGPETIDEVLRGSIKGYLWTKLIRRSLFPDDPFPRIAITEDFCGVVPVLARSKTVALLDETLYRYVSRPGSLANRRSKDPSDFDHQRQTMRSVASDQYARGRNGTVDAVRFDYAEWHMPKVTAAAFNPDRSSARRIARAIASQIEFSDLFLLCRRYPTVAAKALAVKLLGRVYPYLYLPAKWLHRRFDAAALGRKRGSESSAPAPARSPDTRIATAAAGHEPEMVRTA